MKKPVLILLVMMIIVAGSVLVSAQSNEGLQGQAGITPDNSFLWTLERFTENIRLFLTFNQTKKAELRLQLVEERLAEASSMIAKNNFNAAEKAEKEITEEIENIDNSKIENKTKAAIIDSLQKHLSVLQGVLKNAPESARNGLQNAINQSSKAIGKFEINDTKVKGQTEKNITSERYCEGDSDCEEVCSGCCPCKEGIITLNKDYVREMGINPEGNCSGRATIAGCPADEYKKAVCINNSCVIITEKLPCEIDSQCLVNEICINQSCKELECKSCQHFEKHKCVNYECCEDSGCIESKICVNHVCESLSCGTCQYTENHKCINYECCKNEDCSAEQICSANKCANKPNGDTTPPIITITNPQNGINVTTTSVWFNVMTNENAACKYSKIETTLIQCPICYPASCGCAGGGGASAPRNMSETGGIEHSQLIENLKEAASYRVSVNCTDYSGNSNINSVNFVASIS